MLCLRKATVADLETVLHHRREMFREMKSVGDFALAELLSREFVQPRVVPCRGLDGDGGRRGDSGGVSSKPARRESAPAWVVNVYVEQGWRRRGLARRLMDVMVEWIRAEGYSNLFPHASAEGRPLYESMGFGATNEMRLKL